jgi:hypothetical protein
LAVNYGGYTDPIWTDFGRRVNLVATKKSCGEYAINHQAQDAKSRTLCICLHSRAAYIRTKMRLSFIALSFTALLAGCTASHQPLTQKTPNTTAIFSIFPGAPIYAEATVNDDGNISLTEVDKVVNPSITLTFNFTKYDSSMMLSVKNPLNKTIKYHLDMIDYKGNPHNTSSCAVIAGLSVFESWPHPIPEIRISNTHVASKNEEGMCTY